MHKGAEFPEGQLTSESLKTRTQLQQFQIDDTYSVTDMVCFCFFLVLASSNPQGALTLANFA